MKMRSLASQLDAMLMPLGFLRRKATWNRRSARFVDVIDLQRSKAGDRVTVNVGVLEPHVYEMCWGEPAPSLVLEPYCTVRTRPLDGEGRERWWRHEQEGAAEALSREIREAALPFINDMHSGMAMRDWLAKRAMERRLVPPEAVYLALLEAELGNRFEACRQLHTLRSRTLGAWTEKIGELLVRMGCAGEE